MNRDYTLTEESLRKIKAGINRERYQPPPRSHDTRPTDNGDNGKVMKTPVGGIAARSGTTISSAECTQWERSGSTLSVGTATEDVFNLSTTAVASEVLIVAILTNIGWVAVWEDC